jgi:hypothetical protein
VKLQCPCGCLIPDVTDGVPSKAHLIADRDWDAFWEAVDAAVERSGPSAREKEAAVMRLRSLNVFRQAWQCPQCGRVLVEDPSRAVHAFAPEPGAEPPRVFGGARG